jgi:predicted  nucleic acid-binding Zn-ribbon protein
MISRTRATRFEKTRRFSRYFRPASKLSVPGRQGLATTEYTRARRSTEQIIAKLIELQTLERQTKGLTDENGPSRMPIQDSTHIDELRATLPPAVLEHYDYQRSRDRVPVASARGYVCRACFLLLPLSARSVLRAKKKLYSCDYCGAYLYLD